MASTEDKFVSELIDGMKSETHFNKEDNTLPFGYFEPNSEGKVTWICGYDQDQKITSIFMYEGPDGKERKGSYLRDMEDALFHRDELIKAGWQKIKTPEIAFSYGGKTKEKLNRSEKRQLQKKMKEIARNYQA